MHHDPKAQKLHLHALPEQKGAGVCSLTWWLHWEMLPAAAAAAQCLLFPGGQKCAAVFGHPKRREGTTQACMKKLCLTSGHKIFAHIVSLFKIADEN